MTPTLKTMRTAWLVQATAKSLPDSDFSAKDANRPAILEYAFASIKGQKKTGFA